MTRLLWLWHAIIVTSAIGVGLLTFGDIESPVRPLIALWFLCVCPGMAWVRVLHLKERLAEWTLAVALSLALDAMVAGTMLYAGAWSPKWGLVVLICISLAGIVLQIITARGRPWAVRRRGDAPGR